jgi:catechol 2,3-dioxygenase-like lactoylglutathione lyase family enzyme
MTELIEGMLNDLDTGRLSRRQFALTIAALAAGALGAPRAFADAPKTPGMKATSINHISVRVPDIFKTARFYQDVFGMPLRQQGPGVLILGVEDSFFGIEQSVNQTSYVDHFDFGFTHWDADQARALLKEHNLTPQNMTSKESFKFRDPDGFLVQLSGTDYKGHAS